MKEVLCEMVDNSKDKSRQINSLMNTPKSAPNMPTTQYL